LNKNKKNVYTAAFMTFNSNSNNDSNKNNTKNSKIKNKLKNDKTDNDTASNSNNSTPDQSVFSNLSDETSVKQKKKIKVRLSQQHI